MKIGNVHYSKSLSLLSWAKFKRYWKRKGQEDISAEEAARMMGITVPEKRKR